MVPEQQWPTPRPFDLIARVAARVGGASACMVWVGVPGSRPCGVFPPDSDAGHLPEDHERPDPHEQPDDYEQLRSLVVGAGSAVIGGPGGAGPGTVGAWAGWPVRGAEGGVVGALCVIGTRHDAWTPQTLETLEVLTGAVSAQVSWDEVVTEAQTRSWRLKFLADASALLSSLPDSAGLPARLTRFCVPVAAQVAIIEQLHDEELTRVGVAHHDLDRQGELEALPETTVGGPSVGAQRLARVLASGDVDLARVREGDPLGAVLSLGGADPWVITAALRARGRTLGVLTWVAAPGRVYGPDDVELARDFASRAAQAWERAEVFDERSAVAATLQASLLPARLPQVAGIELASRYVAADAAVEVGGDFYDVFPASDGQWVAVMGDVTGRGVEAAGMTGLARHTLRALSRDSAPSAALRALNAVLCEASDDERFATVACARLRPRQGSVAVTLSSGGHCSPIVVRSDGHVELVEVPGTLLGLFQDVDLVDVEVLLAPGDAVVLYTDGVIEARREGELFGEERLVAVLGAESAGSAEELASRILAAVDAFRTQGSDDDRAVLVLRASPVPSPVLAAGEPAAPTRVVDRTQIDLDTQTSEIPTQASANAPPRLVGGGALFAAPAVERLSARTGQELSAWADRYGLVVPAHTRRGTLVYTGDQVGALRLVCRELARGQDEAAAHAVLARALAAEGSDPEAALLLSDPGTLVSRRVLVVDRDPHVVAVVTDALAASGVVVRSAVSIAAAQEHLLTGAVDAAVVEVLLAGESGLDLATDLAEQSVPVVLMSSLRAVDDAFTAGAQAFLSKPLQAAALTSAVADLLAPMTSHHGALA